MTRWSTMLAHLAGEPVEALHVTFSIATRHTCEDDADTSATQPARAGRGSSTAYPALKRAEADAWAERLFALCDAPLR